jgi:malonyl-CoA decarboxylase
MAAAEPPRQELIRRLNQVPGATRRWWRCAPTCCGSGPGRRRSRRSTSISGTSFYSWFNRGFLVLRPINWESPAHILEKIIAYEAVHAIDSWDDLRRRVEPADRRCFAFFHPAMPDEPLIFVEVALTNGFRGRCRRFCRASARSWPRTTPTRPSSTRSRTARRGWPAFPLATR